MTTIPPDETNPHEPLRGCPMVAAVFSDEELALICKDAIVMTNSDEEVDYIFVDVGPMSFEIYTDLHDAREAGVAQIFDCQPEGVGKVSKEEFMAYLRQYGSRPRTVIEVD
ncbi:hypothetical protein [Desulfurispira natronophila]|uniref:Succinylglutamate desuccinylase n=1 Tax=Desulfurispira natronophila TaxID=682562 RepID=A0A7W7Y3F7_9BACT|nr:hypothetical protein [Desulfurispira natronophila]MBB5021352.1 succinylglutamate desuccinylase [Desulfurispira natronophila]